MRTVYFAMNMLLSHHLSDLDTGVRLTLWTERDKVSPKFNEDLMSVEIDVSNVQSFSSAEDYQMLADMRKEGKHPQGLWTENDGRSYRYCGPIKFLHDAKVLDKASAHDLSKIPHIRVIITADQDLPTNPWWWNEEAQEILLKKFAPEWASISYIGTKVNDKAFEAFYIPMVIKPKGVEEAIEALMTSAGTALETMAKTLHSFDRNEVDLDTFL